MAIREGSQSPPKVNCFLCQNWGCLSPLAAESVTGGWAVGEGVYTLSHFCKQSLGPFPSEYADVVHLWVSACAVGWGGSEITLSFR